MFIREGISQKFNGKNKKISNDLNQFNDKLKIVDEGSKTEKRLVIIFNFLKIYY